MASVTRPPAAIDGRLVHRPPPRVARDSSAVMRIIPLVVVIYSFLLLPVEVKLTVGGVNLYSYRIAILAMLPLALSLGLKGRLKICFADILVLIACLWMIVSFIHHYGPGTGIVRSVSLFIDSFGAYVIARMSITTFHDLRRALILIIPGLLVAGAFMMLESVTKTLVVRPFFARIFGSAIVYEAGNASGSLQFVREERMGLLRAYSFFSYPILAGVMLGSLIPLYAMSGLRSWPLYAGIGAAFLGFFSISSATFVALGMGAGLVIADKLIPFLRPLSWTVITWLLVGYSVLANTALEGGIVGLISRFTLNPATAYIRRMQWRYGGQDVLEHPLFGIGFAEYDRPQWLTAAIDAHFLGLGLKHGLPTAVLMFVATVGLIIAIGRQCAQIPRIDRNAALGVNFMLIVLVFASMTVTFFAEANVFFMLALGIAGSSYVIARQTASQIAHARRVMLARATPHGRGQAPRYVAHVQRRSMTPGQDR